MSGRSSYVRLSIRVGVEIRETELGVIRMGDEHEQSTAAGRRSAARATAPGEPAHVHRPSSAPISAAMFSILNTTPSRSPPLITWALIAANRAGVS
jgi:hypothetical protein